MEIICDNKKHFGEKPRARYRISKPGEREEFWCLGCLKKAEPELFNNIKEHRLTEIIAAINQMNKK